MSNLMEPPLLNAGDWIPCLVDQVASGPDGVQVSQMLYNGGNRAYPFHQVLDCRLENVPAVALLPVPLEPTVIVAGALADQPQLSHC